MSKTEMNKLIKKNKLYTTAFELFREKGFAKTTVSDIVNKAGLAKGTFYLYFKDKYDIRDKLIINKTARLFAGAHTEAIRQNPDSFKNYILFITDYIISELNRDRGLLAFISKNLSWGVYGTAFQKKVPEESERYYDYYLKLLDRFDIKCENPELMLFTILELVGSTASSCILHQKPVGIDEYKPYLHRVILSTVRTFCSRESLRGGRTTE